MDKIYKMPFFNRRNWLLENFDKLNINTDEVVLLLLIDYANEFNYKVTLDYLSKKMGKPSNEVDEIIMSLVNKHYINIDVKGEHIYNINNVFEFDISKYEIINNKDVYEIFEEFLNRTLSGEEVSKISLLCEEYGEDKLIDGLRKAEAYDKRSLSYIESILRNEAKSFKEDN